MTTNYWLTYPAKYSDQIKPLLHQQMWLFGQDVVCSKGNLLYQYNFRHQRAQKRGGSMYTLREDSHQIVLWGWGIWYGEADKGGIFVNRYRMKPRFSTEPFLTNTIHVEDDLPPTIFTLQTQEQAETVRELWANLLFWVATYEKWIDEEFGASWREAALKPFPHAFTELSAVDQLSNEWYSLAEQSQGLPIQSANR